MTGVGNLPYLGIETGNSNNDQNNNNNNNNRGGVSFHDPSDISKGPYLEAGNNNGCFAGLTLREWIVNLKT